MAPPSLAGRKATDDVLAVNVPDEHTQWPPRLVRAIVAAKLEADPEVAYFLPSETRLIVGRREVPKGSPLPGRRWELSGDDALSAEHFVIKRSPDGPQFTVSKSGKESSPISLLRRKDPAAGFVTLDSDCAWVLNDGDVICAGYSFFVFRIGDIHGHVAPPMRVALGRFASGTRTTQPDLARGFKLLETVAESDASVLILGETGTGKDLAMRAIHSRSARSGRPCLGLDCGAFAPQLIESELFGHVKGAFTGATQDKAGLFEAADGGTIFLDELGQLSTDLQAKLLRVLETGECRRVGSTTFERPKKFRLVSATNQSLAQKIQQRAFREDLYFRLAGHVIWLPPLRDRFEDLGLAVADILREIASGTAKKAVWHRDLKLKKADPERLRRVVAMLERFFQHPWPGNFRELRNVLGEAVLLGCQEALSGASPVEQQSTTATAASSASIPAMGQRATTRRPPRQTTADELKDALARFNGNRSKAAGFLGIDRTTFLSRCTAAGITLPPVSPTSKT